MLRAADGGDRSGFRNCACADCRGRASRVFVLVSDRRLSEKRTMIRATDDTAVELK